VLNALVFALITGGATAAWFQERELALVMAAAMFVSLLSAAAAGALIPPVLKRLGADPAVGSTVLLTTVTDVVGFLSFLGLASWFLR
jgi:magnesium transporter